MLASTTSSRKYPPITFESLIEAMEKIDQMRPHEKLVDRIEVNKKQSRALLINLEKFRETPFWGITVVTIPYIKKARMYYKNEKTDKNRKD